MDISEQLVHTTVRIEGRDGNGAAHSGTGFFFEFRVNATTTAPVIVTNRHVLEGMRSIIFHLTTANPDRTPNYGRHERIQVNELGQNVMFHPDSSVDLALFFVAGVFKVLTDQGKSPFWRSVGEDQLPTEQLLSSLTSFEDILLIGYPSGLWDSTNNLPLMRRGYTATPFARDFEGRREFVIDAACFPGSSGSPVYLFNQGTFRTADGSITTGSRIGLLGILWGGPQITVQGEIIVSAIPTAMQNVAIPILRFPSHLGYCIKSSRLLDFAPAIRERAAKG